MNHFTQAVVLTNELSSIAMIIETLPPNPHLTEAQELVDKARGLILKGASEVHQHEMKERFTAEDRA